MSAGCIEKEERAYSSPINMCVGTPTASSCKNALSKNTTNAAWLNFQPRPISGEKTWRLK